SPRIERLRRGGLTVRVQQEERVRALEKEGPLLGVEQLEGGEIEDDLVGVHLTEVGQDGRVEREPRGQGISEVEPGAGRKVPSHREAEVVRRARVAESPGDIGDHQESARRLQTFDAFELSVAKQLSMLLAWHEGPQVELISARDVATD